MDIDLKRYRDIAIEELRLTPTNPLERWFADQWNLVAPAISKRISDDQIGRIMNGTRPLHRQHLEIVHRVLTLNMYGLSLEEVWGDEPSVSQPLDPESFRALLKQARVRHEDPLHLLQVHADPRLAFDVEERHSKLAFEAVEGDILETACERKTVLPGAELQLALVAQVRGPVLFMTRHGVTRSIRVLNEYLDKRRTIIYEPNKLIKCPFRQTSTDPGDRDLVAVNWPECLDLASYGLDDLFKRDDLIVTEDEMRAIGGAVADTAHREGERVHASVVPIRIG